MNSIDVDAARPRRHGVAAGRLDPVAVFRLRQHVAEHDRSRREPEERGVDPERADIEIADQDIRQPLSAGAPGALREAIGDEQGRAANDQQHAECDEERRDLEPRHEQAVDEADQGGHDKADDECEAEGRQPGVVKRPHENGREAEQRADREIEFAGRHQKRHRERDEPEFDREGQRIGYVEDGQERGIDRGEDRQLEHEQHERAELGGGDRVAEERGSLRARQVEFVRGRRRVSQLSCIPRAAKPASSRSKVKPWPPTLRLVVEGGRRREASAYLPDRILS